MTNKKAKRIPFLSLILALVLLILAIGGTATFSKFYGGYKNKNDAVKIADAVAKIEVNSVWITPAQGVSTSVKFDINSDSVTVNDVEPEDEIAYYFTVNGVDGKRINEVTMNVTLSIGIRLETISSDSTVKKYYFEGWRDYTEKNGIQSNDVRYCAYLEVFHGARGESETQIPQPQTSTTVVDFTGKSLAVIKNEDGSIVNKTGMVMNADDENKEYAYHIKFKLPKQSSETEKYAGATVYFDISALAEQIRK